MRINGEVKRLDELFGGSFLAAKLNTNGKGLAKLAESGDAETLAVIREGGYSLGIALAAVINLLNPSRLALGSGTSSLPRYADAAKEAAARSTIPGLWQACALSGIRSGETVVALGAVRCVEALKSNKVKREDSQRRVLWQHYFQNGSEPCGMVNPTMLFRMNTSSNRDATSLKNSKASNP